MSLRSFVRNRLRAFVRWYLREGWTNAQIYRSLPEYLQSISRSTLYRTIRTERDRMEVAEHILSLDKRRRYDLRELAGCSGRRQRVRAYITIRWYDREGDRQLERGYAVELRPQGRLSDILNEALSTIAQFFRGKHYDIPEIRSSMVNGRTSYRIEYVECF